MPLWRTSLRIKSAVFTQTLVGVICWIYLEMDINTLDQCTMYFFYEYVWINNFIFSRKNWCLHISLLSAYIQNIYNVPPTTYCTSKIVRFSNSKSLRFAKLKIFIFPFFLSTFYKYYREKPNKCKTFINIWVIRKGMNSKNTKTAGKYGNYSLEIQKLRMYVRCGNE
jgi:hypothetical protein